MSEAEAPTAFMARPPFYLTIHENLRHHVSVRPDKVAMVYEDQSYTFRQVYEDACRIANGLRDRGIRQGDNVGIYLRNCAAYIPIYYALSMTGAVAVPLNYMLRTEQLGPMIERTLCKLLFTELEQYDEVKGLDPSAAGAVPLCSVDEGPGDDVERLDNWLAQDADCSEPDVDVSIHDPMMILFSSGTTASP